MWLSLVEYYVRDVGAAGSNPVTSTNSKFAPPYTGALVFSRFLFTKNYSVLRSKQGEIEMEKSDNKVIIAIVAALIFILAVSLLIIFKNTGSSKDSASGSATTSTTTVSTDTTVTAAETTSATTVEITDAQIVTEEIAPVTEEETTPPVTEPPVQIQTEAPAPVQQLVTEPVYVQPEVTEPVYTPPVETPTEAPYTSPAVNNDDGDWDEGYDTPDDPGQFDVHFKF